MVSENKMIRQSLIEWFPINENDNVLLINASDSSLDEFLEAKCKLTSIKKHGELENAINKQTEYDTVILYDLYGFCIDSDIRVDEMIKKALLVKKKEGTLLMALENKLGMKYFAGCQEEQNGGYYVGIEDYSNWDSVIKPMSKKEIEDVLNEIGDIEYKFYYPYPDYKYPTIIYTDDCLPKEGELFRNIRNIDRDRYIMFDERRAFDSVIKAGLFPEFSNSYLISIV